MMKKYFPIAAVLSLVCLAAVADSAQAQLLRGRRNNGNNGYYNNYYQQSPYYNSPYYDGAMSQRFSNYPPLMGQGMANQGNAADIRVIVPNAQAKVWVDGKMTQQTGIDRLFYTPPLTMGSTYSYRVRASWMENGREMSREETISVAPGQTTRVDFTKNSY